MAKITNFNRDVARNIMNDISKMLSNYASNSELSVQIGTGTFDANRFDVKVSFLVGGDITEAEKKQFEASLRHPLVSDFVLSGFTPEDYGAKFHYGNSVYHLTGFNLNRPKYPFTARREDGKEFKFTESTIRMALKRPLGKDRVKFVPYRIEE